MRSKGRITSWNDARGYGFIAPAGGGKQVFVHIRAFANRNLRPELNASLSYTLSADRQGRPCAADAILAGDRSPRTTTRRTVPLSVMGAAVFSVLLVAAVLMEKLPDWMLALYVFASLITFLVYALDKTAARKGAWRTQESTLHLLALAGGWPGALVAQQQLRHKSRKRSFRAVFLVTVMVNCAALGWLSTPAAAATLRSWLAAIG
ncbi:MAG TPA: cold shock and DUF1294 domain-containing protein [Gammaproteobacteria bacterium]|nr:cold shock and DUF1294 domain-containing protein [Gammaproteobacteria bacterium]